MGKNSLGQSLIEVIFAVTVVGLILGGFVSAMVYFSKVGYVAKESSKATQIGQKKMEELRAVKKRDPDSFWQMAQDYGQDNILVEKVGGFQQETFFIYDNSDDNRKATVSIKVGWTEASQAKSIGLKSYFGEY